MPTPLSTQFISFSCSFRQRLCQIIDWLTPSEKSWIRHNNLAKSWNLIPCLRIIFQCRASIRESGYWGLCAGATVQTQMETQFQQFTQEVYCDCQSGFTDGGVCNGGMNFVHQSVCQTVRSSAIGKLFIFLKLFPILMSPIPTPTVLFLHWLLKLCEK